MPIPCGYSENPRSPGGAPVCEGPGEHLCGISIRTPSYSHQEFCLPTVMRNDGKDIQDRFIQPEIHNRESFTRLPQPFGGLGGRGGGDAARIHSALTPSGRKGDVLEESPYVLDTEDQTMAVPATSV